MSTRGLAFCLAAVLASVACSKAADAKTKPEAEGKPAVAAAVAYVGTGEGGAAESKPTAPTSVETRTSSVGGATPAAPLTPTSKPKSKDASLNAAMVEFVQALRARDVERLLALFPRERPLKVTSSIAGTETFPFEQAAPEMRSRNQDEGLYSLLVEAPDPTFAQFVVDGVEWTWVGGTRFVPDYKDKKSNVYVTWRKERSRWVIDTIGFPVA